jgi:hypothetical protein
MISPGEAFSIFEKWQNEGSFLYLFTAAETGKARLQAAVSEVVKKSSTLRIVARPSDTDAVMMSIDLQGASFEYSDTRETPDPELAAQGWVCFLTAFLPSGSTYLFAECVVEDTHT